MIPIIENSLNFSNLWGFSFSRKNMQIAIPLPHCDWWVMLWMTELTAVSSKIKTICNTFHFVLFLQFSFKKKEFSKWFFHGFYLKHYLFTSFMHSNLWKMNNSLNWEKLFCWNPVFFLAFLGVKVKKLNLSFELKKTLSNDPSFQKTLERI